MKCCENAPKYILMALNIIFMVSLIIVIIMGAMMIDKSQSIEEEDASSVAAIFGSVFIVIGVLMFLLSLLGCTGALKENITMINTYAWILIVLLIFQLIFVIYGGVSGSGAHSSDASSLSLYVTILLQIVCVAMSFILSSSIKKRAHGNDNSYKL